MNNEPIYWARIIMTVFDTVIVCVGVALIYKKTRIKQDDYRITSWTEFFQAIGILAAWTISVLAVICLMNEWSFIFGNRDSATFYTIVNLSWSRIACLGLGWHLKKLQVPIPQPQIAN